MNIIESSRPKTTSFRRRFLFDATWRRKKTESGIQPQVQQVSRFRICARLPYAAAELVRKDVFFCLRNKIEAPMR